MKIDSDSRQVLFFNSNSETLIKVVTGLRPYVGGVGVAIKLSRDFKAQALAIGPLSGVYPAAAGIAVSNFGKLQTLMGDDSLNLRTHGIDAVVSENFALEDLLNRLKEYTSKLAEKPLIPEDPKIYDELYAALLARTEEIWYKKGPNIASCASCPLACDKKFKMVSDITLSDLLGICRSAAGIYDDIPVAFAALTALGYDYSHEELEHGVELVRNMVQPLDSAS